MEPVRRSADISAVSGGAKLLVDTTAVPPEPRQAREPGPGPAKIPGIVAAAGSAAGTAVATTGGTAQATQPAGASLGSLSKLRQQFASKLQNEEAVTIRPLEPETLHRAWQQYADYLRENRNPAVQSLELASLRIIDAQTFEAVTGNNLEQKFIEQEKRNLSDHLQKIFVNKALSFTVTVEEKAAETEEPADRPMNKREQFQQIVEQYPLVKELKDRLRLELDY